MHGLGQVIRQGLLYAKPWQRYALSVALVVLGVALVAFGEAKGVVVAAVGLLIIFFDIRHHVRTRRGQPGSDRPTVS